MSDLNLLERCLPPGEIHDAFRPNPETYTYTDGFQPHYPDPNALLDAIHELHATEPVTTPEHVMRLRDRLARIAMGGAGAVILTNRCNEPVDASMGIDVLANEAIVNMRAVESGMRDAGLREPLIRRSVNGQRGMSQSGKPRSSAIQTLPDGRTVESYMGDMINGMNPDDRTPDPSRMVAAAVQARDLRAMLEERTGSHVVAASEALLLPYASSFIYTDRGGKKVFLAADLPWIGERTNKRPARGNVNHHVELLSQVENSVGVKIGPTSDAAHIEWLSDTFDPVREAGKLVLMLRLGDDVAAMDRVLQGVKRHAPNALLMYDIHGSTVTDGDGVKVRAVEKIVSDITLLDDMALERGLRIRGAHLETIGDSSRRECVNTLGQKPEHTPIVDPLLNPEQTRQVIGRVAARLV